MFFSRIAARQSFKWQIILTFVVGFFFLISAFIAYMVKTESAYRYHNSSEVTTGLAQSLAVSSLSWVLANDVVGLQEVVHSFQSYPELRYAMVISPGGRVLAHSDASKVGKFAADEQSLAMIKAPPGSRVMMDNESIVDIAVPIETDKRHVGWARVGLGREAIAANLRNMILSNMLFVLLATALSLLAAVLIANRLGYRVGLLARVAEEVQAGNFATRASVPGGEDEITKLADSLNQMLDALAQNENKLRAISRYTRSLIEASLDPLVTISPAGKITDVNHATTEVTGRTRDELIGTDFSDYFTEPDRAREGYQQVFLKGSVTDYALAIRHRDGHITDVLYNASVYRNEAEEVLGVFAAARDITERKQAEAALALHIRDLGERIKEIECLRDITDLLLDREMGVEQVLDACARRIPAGWLEPAHTCARIRLGEKSYESANFHEAEAKLEAVIAMPGMEPGLVEVFYFGEGAADGKPPFLDEEHTLIQSISIQISQLLEKRQAEMELRQNQAALQDAQRIAHLGSWRLDVASNHVVWSDELYRMFGLNPELPPPDYTEHSKLFTPESWERLSAAVLSTRQTGTSYELELETVRADGSHGWMLARGEAVRDAHNNIVALYGVVLDITGRKRAEIALRDTYLEMRRFTEVLDNIPSYIYMKDLNRQYIYANKATLKLFGCSAEELVGSGDVKFFPAAAVARLKAVDERVLECGEATLEEIEVDPGNPEWRVYLEVKYPIYDDAGKISGLCGISTDITEHKRLQAEVARGEALFHNYFDLGQIGMAVTSLDQEWLQVNQRLCEILGYTKEELTRMTWTELTHPDDLEPDMVQFRRMLSGEIERYSMDKRFIRKNGEVVHTYLTVSCQRNADRSVEYVLASLEDITWRKKAETELRKLNNDFVTLLENTSDFIYFKDQDSRIRFCSQTLADITGHKSWRDMIGKHDREIFPADTARIYEEEELPIFREGKALLNKTDPYYDEQGKRGWVNTNKWPVFGDDKKTVVGIFGISRDVTELKNAENKINELNRGLEQRVATRTAELEAANKELEAFSYSVSHDLRTPLRAIDGFSRMLLEDYESKLDDEGKRLLNVVRDNTSRMSRLIDDILHFSRAGRTGMTVSAIDMEGLVRAVIDELKPLAAGRKLQINLGQLPNAQGDRTMLHQVFENLLVNAIKFTGKNEEAHIDIGGRIEAGQAVYYVKDDGAGFDMQYAGKLFGVFQRLHGVEEFEGTGIGLAIAKRIIVRHGGTIWAEGEVGKGATFYFSIPAQPANENERSEVSSLRPFAPAKENKGETNEQ